MLEKEERRKRPLFCPRCNEEVIIGDFAWLEIFDDLDRFGKTVLKCPHCRRYFIIREEDEDGPFITTQ